MLAEMSAQELAEWRIRASLDAEIATYSRKGTGVTPAEAYTLVFNKYARQ